MNDITTCILILYNPELSQLKKTIESIYFQVEKILLINNGKDDIPFIKDYSNIEYTELGENKGIAFAQNIGIKRAMELKSNFVLFSDQDSEFPKDYVSKMTGIYNQLEKNGEKVSSLAPSFINENDIERHQPFVTFVNNKLKLEYFTSGVHVVSHSISSGQVIKTNVFENIGFFLEELFIDYVDFEWCWRAENLGYKNFQTASICIAHKIGDNSKQFFNKKIIIRRNIRFYFMIRNILYLLTNSQLTRNQQHYLKLLLVKAEFDFLFQNSNNFSCLRLIYKAKKDGKNKRMGNYLYEQ